MPAFLDAEIRLDVYGGGRRHRHVGKGFRAVFSNEAEDQCLTIRTVADGAYHAFATVKAMFAWLQPGSAGDAASERAVGWITGASLARADYAWTGAQSLWRKLEATRPFWK